MTKRLVTAGLILALAGCGSSGGTTGTGGSGAAAAGGHPGGGQGGGAGTLCAALIGTSGTSMGTVSWTDNGTPECAFLAIVDRTPATLADTIEIDATTESGAAIDIAISSYSGPLGGTYTCQPGNGTSAPYVALIVASSNGGGSTTSDCSVAIDFTTDSAGTEHAQGTFSGTVTGDGGTHVITDGAFDVTVTVNGG
jgi:hypothetical protein